MAGALAAYAIDVTTPQVSRAAWLLVEAGARKGVFDRLRQGLVSTPDLKLARTYLDSKAARLQIPPDHREMYLKLVGEAERWLRQNSKLERVGGLGDLDALGGFFDSIWSGIKAVGGAVAKGAKTVVKGAATVFKAGQETQAGAAEIQARAAEIAENVSQTVKTARAVTDGVATELTAARVDQVAGGFFKSDTGKLVMIGAAGLLLVLLLSGRRKGGR